MKILLFLLMMFSAGAVYAQNRDVWIRYYDTASDRSGYKNNKGEIMIPAKFEGPAASDTFFNITAVGEFTGDKFSSYYLLKDGRKVGMDSVYSFDFQFACESEEKIIFYDRRTDKVGFFDKSGRVIIPAVYNTASPFRNGMSVVIKDATRKCAGEEPAADCEHWSWAGGRTMVINEKNEILIDSVGDWVRRADWYSVKINAKDPDTSLYMTVAGTNGRLYSFIDKDKEFNYWLRNRFAPALSASNNAWKKYVFPEVSFYSPQTDRIKIGSSGWSERERQLLARERFYDEPLTRIYVTYDWYGPEEDDSATFSRFYKACGGYNDDRYPAYSVGVSYYKKRDVPLKPVMPKDAAVVRYDPFDLEYDVDYRNKYYFIRTEDGYRLYSVSLGR